MPADSFYDLEATLSDGSTLDFNDLRGKVILIVNVASLCGFAVQYHELQALYKKYGPERFLVLGFPCNQFGKQEPGTPQEIEAHVQKHFDVSFPILSKVNVNGPSTHEVYKYLKLKKEGVIGFRGIRWNFEKFLIDKEGNVVERHSSLVLPSSLEDRIASLVKA